MYRVGEQWIEIQTTHPRTVMWTRTYWLDVHKIRLCRLETWTPGSLKSDYCILYHSRENISIRNKHHDSYRYQSCFPWDAFQGFWEQHGLPSWAIARQKKIQRSLTFLNPRLSKRLFETIVPVHEHFCVCDHWKIMSKVHKITARSYHNAAWSLSLSERFHLSKQLVDGGLPMVFRYTRDHCMY